VYSGRRFSARDAGEIERGIKAFTLPKFTHRWPMPELANLSLSEGRNLVIDPRRDLHPED